MEEEKKTYAPGTVTISSEEYRDILTEAFMARKAEEKSNDKYWDEYRARRTLEEENEKLREQVAKLEKEFEAVQKNSETFSHDELIDLMTTIAKGKF